MSDVQVTVGADASPFQKVMAQVKAQAKATGETIGVELGTTKGYREEMRMQKGLDIFLRSLAGATDPISAFRAAIEGLSQAFRVVGISVFAVALGGFVYEQFVKARKAADDLTESIQKSLNVNVTTSSVAELKRQVDDFDKLEKKYEDRGLLEKILLSANGVDQLHEAAVRLNELKKLTIELDESAKSAALSEAEMLESSNDPGDRKRGEALRRKIADQDEVNAAQDAYNQAAGARVAADQKVNSIINEQIRLRAALARRTRGTGPGNLPVLDAQLASAKDVQAKAMEIEKNSYAALAGYQIKSKEDTAKAEARITIGATRTTEEEVGRLITEIRGAAFQDAYEKATAGEKAAMLRGQIAQERVAASRDQSLQTHTQHLEAINKISEDQLKLDTLLMQTQQEKTEMLAREKNLQEEVAKAQSDLNDRRADAMGFHGVVSSSRRLGFGHAPAPSQNREVEQLRALGEANQQLRKAVTALNEIKGRLGVAR